MDVLQSLASGETQCTDKQRARHRELCLAIIDEDLTRVQKALERGADPNLRPDLVSPLYLATRSKNIPMIDLLLYADAVYQPVMDTDLLEALGPNDLYHRYVRQMQNRPADKRHAELAHKVPLDKIEHFNQMSLITPSTHRLVVTSEGKLTLDTNYREASR